MSPPASVDDAELARLAAAGEEDAFRELVLRYERPVYGFLLRLVRVRELAEDLAQETFVKAWGALARYDGQHRMASWLFKIAHNAAVDHLRRKGLATVSLTPPDDGEGMGYGATLADPAAETPEHAAERSELAVALEAALASLRPEYREVMVLRFQEGLAYEEIAGVTGLPMGTVKTHIHRARKEMAARLGAEGWGGGL